ncbi:MAG: hypothetical protein H8E73_00560 [Planctomycetes bacterium]|nr:hypothetical protein [Planctomycetota bacterium]MBL7186984.1 hypothetical protein [Phycisphaerae bacterium]
MNYKQIIVVAVGAVAIAWAFLVPSWESYELAETDQGQVLLGKLENRLFNNPPEQSDVREPRIVWSYAAQEAGAYAVVAGILFFFLRTRKARIIAEPQERLSSAAAF